MIEAGETANLRREIGRRLRDARTSAGLHQTDLADKIGVSKDTIGRWERGLQSPDAADLAKMSFKLGLDIVWIVSGQQMVVAEAKRLSKGEHDVMNTDVLVAAIACVEEYLDRARLTLPPEKKGEVIALLVEDAMDRREEERLTKMQGAAGRLLRLVK